jgi:hypothetical protein
MLEAARQKYRSPLHPLIAGIGVLPIVQPIVLLPLTLWLLSRWDGRVMRRGLAAGPRTPHG